MDIIFYSDKSTWVHKTDPRVRIVAAVALSLLLSQATDPKVLLFGLVLAFLGLFAARVPLAAVLQRLVPLNVLLLLLAGLLMVTQPGELLFKVGGIACSWEGLTTGLTITAKANAIVALLAFLVGTIEFVALGKALNQLYFPTKLVNILLFTVRYINLMLAEYERLSRAATLRGFKPGANVHTLRATGFLVGMILVRSYDRGARILQAMKLRGYEGRFPVTGIPPMTLRDHCFLGMTTFIVAAMLAVEFT